jgi:predicted RNase H-like HicB family nuclease
MKTNKTYTASIHKENDIYVASCIEVGTVSQGINIEDALQNLKEATELYLEEFPQIESSPTFLTTFSAELYA